MRHLTFIAFTVLALAGCNGGEDFSDATVPGCPLGANCDLNPRGEIFVELQGPRVANLGYSCGNSTGYTRSEEEMVGLRSLHFMHYVLQIPTALNFILAVIFLRGITSALVVICCHSSLGRAPTRSLWQI